MGLSKPILEVVQAIEHEISSFYDFIIQYSATEFFVDPSEVQRFVSAPENDRGQILVLEDYAQETCEIAIAIGPKIQNILEGQNPCIELSDDNLDAFAVVVEEVSHFHLLTNRVQRGLSISKLELEWQGEVDKVLIPSIFLYKQVQDPHYEPLIRRVFDQATIISTQQDLYWQATKNAARLWFDILSQDKNLGFAHDSEWLRQILQSKYWQGLPEKMRVLDKIRRAA